MMSHGYKGAPMVQRLTTSLQNMKLDVLLNSLIALSYLYFKIGLKFRSRIFNLYRTKHLVVD